jgi:VanZ family protein
MSSTPSTRPRYRRAADVTAQRLGRAVLAYLALITAVITLAPFRFQLTPAHGLTSIWNPSDLVMNVLMFVPFGFVYQLTRPRGASVPLARVLLLGAALSGAIETAQLFAPARYSSLLDVATNAAGAGLGAWLFGRVGARLNNGEAVESLALELPLMGLVYLLVPLCWLLGLGSEGDNRRLLLLVLALIAGAILGTVHAAYVAPEHPSAQSRRRWLVLLPASWVVVAGVPGARGEWSLVAAAAAVVVLGAVLRDLATRRWRDAGTRRFELPTLRLVLPLFVVVLAVSSLWPFTDVGVEWRGTLALTLPGVALSQPMVYRALSHVAAFTLAGYIGAEFYGREPSRDGDAPSVEAPDAPLLEQYGMREILPRVLGFTGVTAVLLEVARGFLPAVGTSALLLVLTQCAALFGAWVYVLQRAHVQALVRRRAR